MRSLQIHGSIPEEYFAYNINAFLTYERFGKQWKSIEYPYPMQRARTTWSIEPSAHNTSMELHIIIHFAKINSLEYEMHVRCVSIKVNDKSIQVLRYGSLMRANRSRRL